MARLEVTRVGNGIVPPISFTLQGGEILCLSGPSGSGKSQLLRMLADLIPHDGQMTLDGCSSEAMPPHDWRRHVGFLSAETAWWADTVRDHMPPDAETRFDDLGLPLRLLDSDPALASTGERQRLALLRMGPPPIMLLDEPTSALDPGATRLVEAYLHRLRDEGTGILVVSHDAAQRARLATRQMELGA
ncbi:ABC transporter ATP-binding protein [Falsirhodobacter deserti]|uniref:ABC transporter ATP-binding protein n=1 Tax=Falsirhodobacter deserti TaxID=1365611 RepID=UPI000FE2FC77|nr:ATP-binding cassette domain-containing protein [Falsirhodobacter deserti]